MVWDRTAVGTSKMRRAYPIVVAFALAALTALMLFATPVVAGDWEDGLAAANEGDYQKAFRLWKPLAEQGWASSQYTLGEIYRSGYRVPENDAKAIYWYRRTAEHGLVDAQRMLGHMYYYGKGAPEDYVQVYAW